MPAAARKPCVRCNQTVHSPAKFLIECCKCHRAWHHPCHIPPIKEAELLTRIEADDQGRPAEGLGAWLCRRCSKTATSSALTIQSTHREFPEPALVKPRQPQPVVRDIEGDRASRATPHIDLLDPPVSQRRTTKVATNHRQGQNTSITIPVPEPIKHEVLTQAQKETTSPTSPLKLQSTSDLSSEGGELPSAATSPPLSRTQSMDTSLSHSRQASIETTDESAARSYLPLTTVPSSDPSLGIGIATMSPARASSPPRIPYVMKGKERMPDFRSLISDLRAAGKLQGPPQLQPEDMPHPQKDLKMETDHETALQRRTSPRVISRDENDIKDMHATPARDSASSRARLDTHDIEDLYATPPPQSARTSSRYDTHDIEDMYATPRPAPHPLPIGTSSFGAREVVQPERPSRSRDGIELQLVFDWQNERYPNGNGDEWFSLITKKMQQIQMNKEGKGSRKARKPGTTHELGKKGKRKREAGTLSFYVSQNACI